MRRRTFLQGSSESELAAVRPELLRHPFLLQQFLPSVPTNLQSTVSRLVNLLLVDESAHTEAAAAYIQRWGMLLETEGLDLFYTETNLNAIEYYKI